MKTNNRLFILFANFLSLIVLVVGTFAVPTANLVVYALAEAPEPLVKVVNPIDGDITDKQKIVAGNDYQLEISATKDQTLLLPVNEAFQLSRLTLDTAGKLQRSHLPEVDEQQYLQMSGMNQGEKTASVGTSVSGEESSGDSIRTNTRSDQQLVAPTSSFSTDAFVVGQKYYIFQIKANQHLNLEFTRLKEAEMVFKVYAAQAYLADSKKATAQMLFTFQSMAEVKGQQAASDKESAGQTATEQAQAVADLELIQAPAASGAVSLAAASGVTLDTIDLTINGQLLKPNGNIQIKGAQMFPNASHLKGQFNGDGVTTIYQIPIHITNVGKDSIGSFGPLENAGDVYDAVTGAKVGQIKQTGTWDSPKAGEYTGMYFIQLDKPLSGATKFDVQLSGAGNINALKSNSAFQISINNQFNYTVTPEKRDLTTPDPFKNIGVGQYGVDGNQGYVYIGSDTYNATLQDLLLDAVNKKINANYQIGTGSYKGNPQILLGGGSSNHSLDAVLPKTNLIVTQTLSIDKSDKNDGGATITGVEVGQQGTHTWRISDGKTTNPESNGAQLYLLTKDRTTIGDPDINKGIESTRTATQLTPPPGIITDEELAKWMNQTLSETQRREGNQYLVYDNGNGTLIVAYNYGNFATRTGFTTKEYFGDKVGTASDAVQEVDRSTSVNNGIDQVLSTTSNLEVWDQYFYSGGTESGVRTHSFKYKGQVFDNYMNIKVLLNKNVYAKVKSEMRSFVYGTQKGVAGTYDLNSTLTEFKTQDGLKTSFSGYGKMPTTGISVKPVNITYATNRPTNGILNGQTIVNVYYVTKDGKEVLPSKHYIGWPEGIVVGTPDPPFEVTAPQVTPFGGRDLTLYNQNDADGFLNPKYGVNGRHLIHTDNSDPVRDTLRYPPGPTGTEANYYYVYNAGTAPYSFKKYAKGTDQTLAGASFVVSTYPAGANNARDINDQIRAEEAKGAEKDQAKIDQLWQQMSHFVVRSYENTSYGSNTDNYGAVWNQIKDEILSQQINPNTGQIIYTQYKYDLNHDGKVDDADKEIWINDASLILKATSAYNGVVSFGNLEVNKTYYLVELTPPTGYSLSNPSDYDQLPSDTQYRFWVGDKNQLPNPSDFRVDNSTEPTKPPTGQLEITKVAGDDTQQKLAGAEFLFTWSGDVAKEVLQYSIDRQKAIDAGNQAEATRLAGEISRRVLRNYTDTPVGNNSTNWGPIWEQIKNTTDTHGKLIYDYNKDNKIDDTDKDLWANDYSKVAIAKSDADGLAVMEAIDMEGGTSRTLYAIEIKAPTGYQLPDPATLNPDDFKITINKDQTSQLYLGKQTINNTKIPAPPVTNVKVIKVDQKDHQQLLKNAVFILSDTPANAQKAQQIASDVQRLLYQLISEGKTADEIDAAIAPLMARLSQLVLLSYDPTYGKINSFEQIASAWQDHQEDLNQDGKTDDQDKVLFYSQRVYFGKTDDNGEANFTNIDPDSDRDHDRKLYAIEYQAPTGYAFSQTIVPVDIKDGIGKTTSITVENLPSKVIIDKISPTDQTKLPGAEFELYDANNNLVQFDSAGNPIGKLTTTKLDANGNPVLGADGKPQYQQIVIHNLPLGDYRLVETKAPAGHELLKHGIKFTLSKDNAVDGVALYQVTISNVAHTELPFTGSDSQWQKSAMALSVLVIVLSGLYVVAKKRGVGKNETEI